jgi:hypothetical protein
MMPYIAAMKLDPLTRRTLLDWCGTIVIPLHSYGNCLPCLYSHYLSVLHSVDDFL